MSLLLYIFDFEHSISCVERDIENVLTPQPVSICGIYLTVPCGYLKGSKGRQ